MQTHPFDAHSDNDAETIALGAAGSAKPRAEGLVAGGEPPQTNAWPSRKRTLGPPASGPCAEDSLGSTRLEADGRAGGG